MNRHPNKRCFHTKACDTYILNAVCSFYMLSIKYQKCLYSTNLITTFTCIRDISNRLSDIRRNRI